jgi:hypothetical protein
VLKPEKQDGEDDLIKIGLFALNLQAMATIISRRIPPATADRLEQFQQWTGDVSKKLNLDLFSTQQASWDRYVLERSLRGVPTAVETKTDGAKRGSKPSSPGGRRKM